MPRVKELPLQRRQSILLTFRGLLFADSLAGNAEL